jgi:FAD/FMN-containing dehydrogenase
MTLTPAAVRELVSRIGGRAVHRDEEGWESLARSRFPNPQVPWRSDVVVLPAGVADVMQATRFAREHELGLAVRGGGVGWIGAQPGTLLLDLRNLNGVRVNPTARSVYLQGGAIWRDVSRELAPFHLAAASPQFPRLGVTGHVLGGGHGWLSRKLGWASDTLLNADLITADGRLVHCSKNEEPELFWALRGAGANFGTVVGLELSLVELRSVTFGLVWFHPDATADGLAWCREHLPNKPDELTTIISVGHPPASIDLPNELEGRAALHVILCHCGAPEQAVRDLADLRQHPRVTADTVRQTPWPELAMGKDVFISGVHRRSRMRYLPDLNDEVIATSASRAREMAPLSFMSTHLYGGRMSRIAEDATAMSHRSELWNYMVSTTWTSMENGTELRSWQDSYLAEIAQHASSSAYVNYLFDEPHRVQNAYNPKTWTRLRELKRKWDPDNYFAANQNIPPT